MGADEPGFDVAEEGMDDWEEGAGIGGFVLNHWRVLQMLGEGGIAAAITREPVGQQTGPGRELSFRKAPSSTAVAAGSTAMRALPAKKPCCRFTACPDFPFWLCGAGTFSTAATTKLLSGLAVLRPRLVGSPRPPMKVSSASSKPPSGRAESSLSPWRNLCAMVHAVWYATASSPCRNLADTPRLSRPIR